MKWSSDVGGDRGVVASNKPRRVTFICKRSVRLLIYTVNNEPCSKIYIAYRY